MGEFIISIDPSIYSMGITEGFIDKDGFHLYRCYNLDLINRNKIKGDMTYACMLSACEHIKRVVNEFFVGYKSSLILEVPENFNSNKGQSAINSGSIQKLYTLTGMIILTCYEYLVSDIYLIKPIKWKGNVPKKVMLKRARKLHPDLADNCKHDAAESLLLLDFYMKNKDKFYHIQKELPQYKVVQY